MPAELIALASEREALRMVREQANAISVLRVATEELRKAPQLGDEPVTEMSEDWLNAFEREAVTMSSEEMQQLFGKILAGEIRKPSSYSKRTVKLIASLDNEAAILFRTLCSMVCVVRTNDKIVDARVIEFGKTAGKNGLAPFGLNFPAIAILIEYGLVAPQLATEMPYTAMTAHDGKVQTVFFYTGAARGLAATNPPGTMTTGGFSVKGVQLSGAGMELFDIVSMAQ